MTCKAEDLRARIPLLPLLDDDEMAVLSRHRSRFKKFAPRQRIYKIGRTWKTCLGDDSLV